MGKNTRSSGIDIIGDVPWGTHLCQFYREKEDLMDMLVPFFKAGLENNELCVWITAQPVEVEEAKEALRKAVPEIDIYLEKGQMEIIPYIHGYVKEGVFDPERVVDSWVEKIHQVLTEGYDGLRATGDTRWLEKDGWDDFVDYEKKVDVLIDKYHVIALCPYSLDMCGATEIIDVVSNHQFALIKRKGKWERIENFGRKRAEEALQESEERFRTVFTKAAAGLIIVSPEISYHEVNERFCEITGYSREELLSKNCPQLVHPDDQEENAAEVKRLLDGETASFVKNLRFIGADGRIIWVRMNASLLHDYEQGKDSQPKLIGVVEDITERKKAEDILKKAHDSLEEKVKERTAELELSKERYRSFIQNFKGIAFQADKDFNLEFAKGNVEEITGYNEEELRSKKLWRKLIEPEDLPLFLKEERALKNSPSVYDGELDYRMRCKDGKIKWVHEIYQKIPGKSGKTDKYQGAIYDITERKTAEDALAKIENARKKEIHHRIKNNLQVISSLLDLQAEKFSDREMVCTPEILEAFRESQNRVISMSLIHEELYKGEEIDTLDFSAYLRKLAENLFQTYNLSSENIRLCMDLEENAFFNMDTAVPLGIIVNELVSNSLKHAFTEEGEVRIKLCREEKDNKMQKSLFSLTISDNGKGVPENMKLGSLESLGLQLVSILVDQLDGKIELKRAQGTEFKITFKVAER